MYLVYGTKRKVRRIGWVADFCEICRRPQSFEICRIGLASHLYYISFGEGKLAGHLMYCGECKTPVATDRERYVGFVKKRSDDIAALAAATMPNLPEKLGDRLTLEKRISEDPSQIESDLRVKLLLEPFRITEGFLKEKLPKGSEMDAPAGIGCFGTILLFVGFMAGLIYLPPKWHDFVLKGGGILMGIGVLYTLVQLALVPGRFARKELLPRLVKALAPLKPTQEEIENTMKKCKQWDMKVAKMLKPQELWGRLNPLR